MNLLEFKNRFKPSSFVPTNIYEVNGYMGALQDLLEYLKFKTEFNPAKRMVDSVDILECITETNTALMVIQSSHEKDLQGTFNDLAGVDLDSGKVKSFLKEQTKTDDIPDSLFNGLHEVDKGIEAERTRFHENKNEAK